MEATLKNYIWPEKGKGGSMKKLIAVTAMVFLIGTVATYAATPPVSEIRQCTLCDGGWVIFKNNPWLKNEYQGKVLWVALRPKDAATPRQVFVAGVGENRLVVHNQRLITENVDPVRLAGFFGANFYKFGAETKIPLTKSATIEKVGLMVNIPLLSELPNPAKTVPDSNCGTTYPVDRHNWESGMPAGSLFFNFSGETGKVKFEKRTIGKVSTFDCERGLTNWSQVKNFYATGPLFYNKDGVFAGEIINTNPPPRFPKKILGDCQNDYEVNGQRDLIVTVERSAPQSTSCFVSLKARLGNETITLFCWKDVFVSLTAGNPPIDLGAYFPDFDFTKQYKPIEGTALWIGIVAPIDFGEYQISGTAWQAKIPQKVVFAQINKTSTPNVYKVKVNIRVNSTLVWTVDAKTVQETSSWNSVVLKKHLPNYNFATQYCPEFGSDTVWAAY